MLGLKIFGVTSLTGKSQGRKSFCFFADQGKWTIKVNSLTKSYFFTSRQPNYQFQCYLDSFER